MDDDDYDENGSNIDDNNFFGREKNKGKKIKETKWNKKCPITKFVQNHIISFAIYQV